MEHFDVSYLVSYNTVFADFLVDDMFCTINFF